MKTTDEIAAIAFARREEHERKVSKRKKTAALTVIPVLTLALTAGALAASGAFGKTRTDTEKEALKARITKVEESLESERRTNDTLPGLSDAEDVIAINRLEASAIISNDYAAEECTHADIAEKFGEWVFPVVPAGLAEGFCSTEPEEMASKYGRWFFVRLSSSTESKCLLVEMREGRRSFHECCIRLPLTEYERSVVSGKDVWIGEKDNSEIQYKRYECVFEHKGIWFKFESAGLTQDELVEAIRSVVES